MAIGVIATLVGFAVAAVYARGQFMDLLARSEGLRLRVGKSAETAGACAVIVLGLVMLSK
jgi:ABC-type nickel/cobalt efflux system permease component RcnA